MSETVTQVNETTQKIVRSRTCGLKDFYIALVQSNTATAYTAGTPVKLARAIKAKIDEKWKLSSETNHGMASSGRICGQLGVSDNSGIVCDWLGRIFWQRTWKQYSEAGKCT